MRPWAQGPVWPFQQVSGLRSAHALTVSGLSPMVLGLVLLLESPQHPSAGMGVLSPTTQWGNL